MHCYKNYYHSINKNSNSKKIFYKYFSKVKTYKESFKFAKKVFTFLIKYKRKKIVTYSNKSFEMYSSIFPILVSNCIWIPLSINSPYEKIKYIISITKPDVFFYDHLNYKVINLFKKNKIKCIKLKSLYKIREKKCNFDIPIKKLDINSTAFIYFTSGSTGYPKGINITHKNIISDVFEQKNNLYNNEINNLVFGDYYDTAFSIFFDIYFPAIFFGSTLSPGISKSDNYSIYEHFKKNGVNTLVAVPSSFERIREYLSNNKIILKGKNLILTGEPFYLGLLNFIFSNLKFNKIYNCYGGTEMGNWVFFHKCTLKDLTTFKNINLVPIGRPFKTVKAKIIKNELVVKGPMITNGYIDKNLNKNKFIFNNENTFYTGDKVIKKKNIYICRGRSDGMVKIRGYRIELLEIESSIRRLAYVKDVVVFEKKKRSYNNYLVAVFSFLNKTSIESFKKDILNFLPNYMIPKKLILVNNLPRNTNGKIDRRKIRENY